MAEPTIRIFGRPTLAPSQKRSEVVATRLRPQEYDVAYQRAKAAGYDNVADYTRSLLTGTVTPQK